MRKYKVFIKIVLRILIQPLLHLVYFLSGFFPRNKKIWVFGSAGGKRFADNSKWFFYYCYSHKRETSNLDMEYIWISKNKEIVQDLRNRYFKAYYYLSLQGIYYSLRAGVYIFDAYIYDINHYFSRRAIKVNLWHGSPLKRIERHITKKNSIYYKAEHGTFFEKLRIYFINPGIFTKYDMVIAASDYVKEIFQSAFPLLNNHVVVTGYPRNDVLIGTDYTLDFLNNESYIKSIEDIKELKNGKIIAYLPTFRDSEEGKSNLDPHFFEKMNDFLKQYNFFLIIKPHINDSIDKNKFINISNIVLLDPTEDIYPLLKISDILITDYSSVYFDFILLDGPIVFFPYDLVSYLTNDRKLYIEYDMVTPGPKVESLDMLLNVLKDLFSNSTLTKESNYIYVKEKYNKYVYDSFSERVYNEIDVLIKNKN